MAKWKELGEVPDSDEESLLDSEESQSQSQLLEISSGNGGDEPRAHVPAAQDDSIWDIAPSSQNPEDGEQASKDTNTNPIVASKAMQPKPALSPLSPAPPAEEDTKSSPRVVGCREKSPSPIHSTTPDFQESSPVRATESERERVDNLEQHDEELAAAAESARSGRALRPRKPIQQHPYLLESAQYSSILKSHGVRPIRIAMEEAARRKAEEDSREQDYEDESPLAVGDELVEDEEESQESRQQGTLDDIDELALSSPVRPDHSRQRRNMSSQDIPRSSQSSIDDLPSLEEIFKSRPAGNRDVEALKKRRGSPKTSSKRKNPKLREPVRFAAPTSPRRQNVDIFDIPPSPPQTSPAFLSATPMAPALPSKSVGFSLTPKLSSSNASRDPTPAPGNQDNTVDLTALDDEISFGEDDFGILGRRDPVDDDAGASSGSESDTDIVGQARRRIRGVLPASWLRLDQQVNREKANKARQQRNPDRSPERAQRKGVAQRRQVSPKPNNDLAFLLHEDSDDDTNLRSNDARDAAETREFSIFDDDAGSVIEEDHIDHMAPGRKRVNSSLDGQRRLAKRRKTQKVFQGQTGGPKRQQRIIGLLSRSKSGQYTNNTRSRHTANGGRKPRASRHEPVAPRPATPPRLSILDVIEPDAPSFLRIAARTAKRRPDKGRSSPSSKLISLGTRRDNIDTLGVLRNWKNGKIRPKLPLSVPIQQPDVPHPLRPISSNSVVNGPSEPKPKPTPARTTPASRFSRSRKLVRQTNMDKFVTVEPVSTRTLSPSDDEDVRPAVEPTRRLPVARIRNHGAQPRPAQLEADGPVSRSAFGAQKKMLDALYRKSLKSLPSAASIRLDRSMTNISLASDVSRPAKEAWSAIFPQATDAVTAPSKTRPRVRKHARPRLIDTTAPQYAYANDPLPVEVIHIPEAVATPGIDAKLMGLGPFGTHYSQHFEIFPLDPGVFFHESTLIGDGRLVKALDNKRWGALSQSRGNCALTLNGKILRWGSWDGQISSEIGVLFDLILDKLQPEIVPAETSEAPGAVEAADFVVNYLQDHLSFPEVDSPRHFVKRMLEVVEGFTERLGFIANASGSSLRQPIEVSTRCVIIALQTLRISQNLAISESLQIEEALKKTAKQAARMLFKGGLDDIRSFYIDLQQSSFRDRGIRNQQYSVIGWVTLIQILQEARIPRAGFWDIVSPIMLDGPPTPIVDAHVLETLWKNLFTLLPLGEFDNAGVAVTGRRQAMPLEGWNLPQKLLSRVFELYKGNQRQAPSFNDYCRGIMSRCHYLVEHWGWRKCNAIIGTIFDFFASQNLSHLRNEEVYSSPQFLEELAGTPSLTVQPEDRCFHIFLKLLALAIKRLRSFRAIKDVRNLVARVLPNHDRQYLKERDIHANELAALRNHHDILCTLFWSAPAELRPSVQTIEKLVTPGSSHKEACLINLRAWNQLARFVISSGEDRSVFKPFTEWQNNVFRQVLEQHTSAESDIQQQFLRMSKDASSGVSQDMIRRVVNINKQAATDVLHFSLKATLDVLLHAPSLGIASFVVNTYQLHEVFSHFCLSPLSFDWSSLSVTLDTVDQYLTRIEKFLDQQVAGSEPPESSWQGDDAIMLLDRHISPTFYFMARNLLSVTVNNNKLSKAGDIQNLCLEQLVSVGGRMAALFIHSGVSRLSQFFSTMKYGLFEALPTKLPLQARKYLGLFISILIDRGVVEFKDIGATRLELLMCAMVKPHNALAYENRLAQTMKQHDGQYLKDAVVEVGNSPDYNSNRDLFAYTISRMRKALRIANASQRQQLQPEIWKALRAAMDQMKRDLTAITDTPEHANYIQFVRSIIPLIKTNDICPVDKFFYEISKEYSPSAQDPRLQTAAILSYGLKLEDGDTRAVPGLFYSLYPNFKLALSNGKLYDEGSILEKSMRNAHIMSFMLSWMLPSLIRAAVRVPDAWILLDVYVGSVDRLITGPCIHKEIGEEYMNDLAVLLRFATAGIQHLGAQETSNTVSLYLHSLFQMTKLFNLFGPSMTAFLCLNSKMETGLALKAAIASFTDFTRTADEYLVEALGTPSDAPVQIELQRLCDGVRYHIADQALEQNDNINSFAKHIMEDMQKTWVVDGFTISVRGPARGPPGSSTQSGQGTLLPTWDVRKLAAALREQVEEWNYVNDRSSLRRNGRGMIPGANFLF